MLKRHIFVVLAVVAIAGCRSEGTSDVEGIVQTFREGLQLSQRADSDMLGAAIIALALDQFMANPDAATEMFGAFEQFVSQSDLQVRYQQWGTFLESLDAALLQSKDADHLRQNWHIYQLVVDAQEKTLRECVEDIVVRLEAYASEISTQDLDKVQPFAGQDEIDFLFDIGSGAVEVPDMPVLKQKIGQVVESIEEKLLQSVVRFEQEVEAERNRDLDTSVAPSRESEVDGRVSWKKGRYQEILEGIRSLSFVLNASGLLSWAGYNEETSDTDVASDFSSRLKTASQEAQRLQRLRYNLWAVRTLSADSTILQISFIDTGMLEPVVGALYSQREGELITRQTDHREREVRTLLLQEKVSLEAF